MYGHMFKYLNEYFYIAVVAVDDTLFYVPHIVCGGSVLVFSFCIPLCPS